MRWRQRIWPSPWRSSARLTRWPRKRPARPMHGSGRHRSPWPRPRYSGTSPSQYPSLSSPTSWASPGPQPKNERRACIRGSASTPGTRQSAGPAPWASSAQLGADRASGRDGAELLHQGHAVELRPHVGHPTVLQAVEVHALDPDRLAGGGDPHELLLLGTGHHPPGGHGGAAGHDVLQVLHQVGEDRLEARDLLPEAGQRRLFVGRWIVVDQARVAELADGRLVGRAKRVLEARDDLDVVGQGRSLSSAGADVATDWLLH